MSALQTSTLLSVSELSWQVNAKAILRDISFDIQQGEFVGLLGPNGSGKSSLLRCLYRYLVPSSGSVYLQHRNLSDYDATEFAKQVAVVLQHTPQQFHLSVTDVVFLGLLPHNPWFFSRTKQQKQLVADAIEQVGLSEKSQQDFELLSGGEKQRVMIARAIVQQPKLLFMDEPTSHLDVKYQIQIMELAKSLGVTVLASFHDLNLAASMCDKILMLKQGQLVAQGTPTQVITEQNLSDVFDVCAKVDTHPQCGSPLVTYFYGYDHDHTQKQEREKGVTNEQ